MKLVFATHNAHKLREVSALLPQVEVLSLDAIDCTEELPETSDTFEGNAAQKAQYIYDKYGVNCFADDSGLEVAALGGSPGIYSARYAGTLQPGDNMARLLLEMRDNDDRRARFKTVLVSIIDGEQHAFEGLLPGTLANEARGRQGFGYDPVFIPEGRSATLAEMTPDEKNAISHRAEACRKFATYLDALVLTPKTTHGSNR